MRVTQTMLVSDLLRNLNSSMNKMDGLQMQLSSGQRINRPSDDPAGLVKSLRMRTSLSESSQYKINVADGVNFMNATDQSLSDISQVLQKVRELTVKAATATNETDSWASISQEIGQLNEQIQLLANAQYGTKYLFSGSNVTQMPWNSTTGVWSGNNQELLTEIATGTTSAINVKMKEFFMGRLNDLLLQSVRSGIRNIKTSNLQEGQYQVATGTNLGGSSVSTERSSRGAESAYYLYQAGGAVAAISSGQAAGAADSEYQGELNFTITALDDVANTATVNISGRMAVNGGEYQNVDFQGIELNMSAAAGGAIMTIPATAAGNANSIDDCIPGAVQDLVLWNSSPAALQGVMGNMAVGQGFGVQLATDAAGAASSASEIPAQLVKIKDQGSFFWVDELTPASIGAGSNARLADSSYSGSLQLRVTGVDTPAAEQLTVSVTGRIALPGGSYKEVQFDNVIMQMNATNGQAIMTIPAADIQDYIPEAIEDLVIWNSSGLDLMGINDSPQFSIGDSTLLELGSTESKAVETQQYLSSVSNYGSFFYEAIDQEATLGVGSGANANNSAYNGSLLIEATTVDVETDRILARVKGHVYLDDGSYQYVDMQNVELNMNAAAGQAIFTIPATQLPGATEDLVIWNNSLSGSNLGGLDLLPLDNDTAEKDKTCQINAGDRCVIALSARQYNASAAAQYDQVLNAPDSNGMFFYQGATVPASISSGNAAGANYSPYSGSLQIAVNAVNAGAEQLTVTVNGNIVTPDGNNYNLAAPIAGVTMQMDAASNGAICTLTAAQLQAATGAPAGTFTEDLVLWNSSSASLGAINDANPEFAAGDTVSLDIFASTASSARVEDSQPSLNSLSNNGMFFFDDDLIPQAASLVAGSGVNLQNSLYNGDLKIKVTGVNAGTDELTVDITGSIALPGGGLTEVSFTGLIMDMAADHAAGQPVLTIPASAAGPNNSIDDYIPGATQDLVFWSPSTLGGINAANPEFAVGDEVGLYLSSQDSTSIGFQYDDEDGLPMPGGTHSFNFLEHTMDRSTTDFRFFTLNEGTGLEFDGTMSLVVEDFRAEAEAASFEYEAGIFQFMTDLGRTVEAGRLPETGNELEGIDIRMSELLAKQATLGARINRMETQESHLTDMEEAYTAILAKVEDADMAQIIMKLQLQENVYRAALSAGARIIQPTLLDFLG